MTFQDFHNIQSGHNITAELFKCGLFWKLSKKVQNADTLRLCDSELIHTFLKPNSFIHGVYSVLSLYAVFALKNYLLRCAETIKSKHVFRKIEIIHVLYPLLHKNEILWTPVIHAVSRQCFQICAVKIPISPGPG